MFKRISFERDGVAWEKSAEGLCYVNNKSFHDNQSLYIPGSLQEERFVRQSVPVRTARATRETFTLSGWASAQAFSSHERPGVDTPPRFRLRAVLHYNDPYYKQYGTEEYVADFAPRTEEWQFASVQFSKSRFLRADHIDVYCEYSYNGGCAYFDSIQLTQDAPETGLSASDFSESSSVDGGSASDGEPESTQVVNTADSLTDPSGA